MDIANIIVRKDNNQMLTCCHYPMLFWPSGSWMLHGHIHSGPMSSSKEKAPFHPLRYDVGCDNNNYQPISYIELSEIIDKQKEKQISINLSEQV